METSNGDDAANDGTKGGGGAHGDAKGKKEQERQMSTRRERKGSKVTGVRIRGRVAPDPVAAAAGMFYKSAEG